MSIQIYDHKLSVRNAIETVDEFERRAQGLSQYFSNSFQMTGSYFS